MAAINEGDKREFLSLAASFALKEDMSYLSMHRHNPVIADGVPDMDRALSFLTEFNEFINHEPKPFEPMVDREMKL